MDDNLFRHLVGTRVELVGRQAETLAPVGFRHGHSEKRGAFLGRPKCSN